MALTKDKKKKVIADYKRDKHDTGSAEVQIALLTERINELSAHLQGHHKDVSSRHGLLMMVARRRKLLDYVKRVDDARYQDLIKRLNIRR